MVSWALLAVDDETGKFNADPLHRFTHPYPATKVMFIPDKDCSRPDLLATTGDYLRIWHVGEDGVKLQKLLNNVRSCTWAATGLGRSLLPCFSVSLAAYVSICPCLSSTNRVGCLMLLVPCESSLPSHLRKSVFRCYLLVPTDCTLFVAQKAICLAEQDQRLLRASDIL